MQGLDSLAMRLKEYYDRGSIHKWRSPIEVDEAEGRPTDLLSRANEILALRSDFSDIGMVPLVEPDVVMKGTHSLETAEALNVEIASCLYREMLLAGSSWRAASPRLTWFARACPVPTTTPLRYRERHSQRAPANHAHCDPWRELSVRRASLRTHAAV